MKKETLTSFENFTRFILTLFMQQMHDLLFSMKTNYVFLFQNNFVNTNVKVRY